MFVDSLDIPVFVVNVFRSLLADGERTDVFLHEGFHYLRVEISHDGYGGTGGIREKPLHIARKGREVEFREKLSGDELPAGIVPVQVWNTFALELEIRHFLQIRQQVREIVQTGLYFGFFETGVGVHQIYQLEHRFEVFGRAVGTDALRKFLQGDGCAYRFSCKHFLEFCGRESGQSLILAQDTENVFFD